MGLYKKILLFHYYSTMKRKTTFKAKPKNGFKKRRSNTSQAILTKSVIAERKYIDITRTGLAILASTTNWAGGILDPAIVGCLFPPVLGDDIFNRQGRKVQVLQLKISGQIGCPHQIGTASPNTASIVRIALVQDTQTNGAQLFPENVFGATNTLSEPTDMFQNPQFFGRFHVLKQWKTVFQDQTLTFDTAAGGLVISGLAKTFKMNVKFKKPVVVHYNSTNGGTVADIVDNSFHMIGICSNSDLAPLIAYRCRTTFIDV